MQVPVFSHLSAGREAGQARQQDHHHDNFEREDDEMLFACVLNDVLGVGHLSNLTLDGHKGTVVRRNELVQIRLARRQYAERL